MFLESNSTYSVPFSFLGWLLIQYFVNLNDKADRFYYIRFIISFFILKLIKYEKYSLQNFILLNGIKLLGMFDFYAKLF